MIESLITNVCYGDLIYSKSAILTVSEAVKSAVKIEYEDIDKKILILVHEGKTDSDISKDVGLGEDAVGKRLTNLYKKTGIHDRAIMSQWFINYVLPLTEENNLPQITG